eukprot:TRINITY_DN2433_c0_g1_i1.p1 TRINITY_DN2433_c0_g1~~TRINITY_DN2433_c0_g1_i1.p1  ORF type:complete len:459 (-),score=99.44 TRINITY_DN2433_c0_g1_i1:61-1437(-)
MSSAFPRLLTAPLHTPPALPPSLSLTRSLNHFSSRPGLVHSLHPSLHQLSPTPTSTFTSLPPFYPSVHIRTLSSMASTMSPKQVKLVKSANLLKLTWKDGATTDFPALFLRQNSRSAAHIGHTDAPLKPLSSIHSDVAILGLEKVGTYGINIQFDDLHDSGIYTWEYLNELRSALPTWNSSAAYISKYIDIANGRFHYYDYCSPSLPKDAPVILMVHGFNQSGMSFKEFCEKVTHTHRVICVDQRGHGESLQVKESVYTREKMVEDLHQIVEKLQLSQFLLVGMSMGAANSIVFASQFPLLVKKLVLIDYAPKLMREGLEKIYAMLKVDFSSFEEAVDTIHKFAPQRDRDQIKERLQYTMHERPNKRWGWRVDPEIWGKRLEASENKEFMEETWAAVKLIQCPTILVKGEKSDVLSPEVALKMVDTLKEGKLKTVANAGHSVAGDNPQGFYEAVEEFL